MYNLRSKQTWIQLLLLFSFPAILLCVRNATWTELISTNGVKFTARNAHASCVFKGRIWLVGGRTASFVDYNLQTSYKTADVWYSYDGAIWAQQSALLGDFFAQNIDVVQPGEVAPFFPRFGHSLNAIDIDGDNETDIMVLAGGYSPSPSNDVWVTTDGQTWLYTGQAPWAPRGWHGSVVFKNRLHIMGGSPLNNEIWMLANVTNITRAVTPLTRSLFSTHTYDLQWILLGNASWSPRVGMGLVSQVWYDVNQGETIEDGRERLILAGGYGGWVDGVQYSTTNTTDGLAGPPKYDGYRCRGDTWESYDAIHWSLLNNSNFFSPRAWFGMATYHGGNPALDILASIANPQPPRLFIFGGGYVGFTVGSQKQVNIMQGYADAYVSRDGIIWTRINYQEGGGSTFIPFYSSELWAKTLVNSATTYLGLWGHTVVSFNPSTGLEYPGQLILIGGDYVSAGDFSSSVYESTAALFCNTNGVSCSGSGTCTANGCVCKVGYTGEQCEQTSIVVSSAMGRLLEGLVVKVQVVVIVVLALYMNINYE